MLLERGVSVDSCRAALPEWMEMNQWLLVARAMEYDVDDALGRQVLRQAMEREQGSVVWHCINTLTSESLTVEKRESLFRQACRHKVWQVVKRLVEEKDLAGVTYRNIALVEAIE